jgi:alpha-ketoglutarate-dependent taurine dioxygenase
MAGLILPEPGRPYAMLTAEHEATVLDVAPGAIEALYKAHGALLLRGFAVDVDLLGRFADRMCCASMPNEGPHRLMLDPVHSIQTVAGGERAFPLHPELSREPWKPDVAMFACLNPPSEGGETLICDGVALAAALPPPIYAAFAQWRLRYIYAATPEMLAYWLGTETPSDAQLAAPPPECPFSFTRGPNRILRHFTRPALHRPMFSDAPAFGNYLLFARYFHGTGDVPVLEDGRPVPHLWCEAVRMIGERLSVPIEWREGDLLVLDNSRFMHGRNAITDLDERRIISYFGYLRWAEPGAEEPADAPWRRPGFRPPLPKRAWDAKTG